jgi:hypothetical protein
MQEQKTSEGIENLVWIKQRPSDGDRAANGNEWAERGARKEKKMQFARYYLISGKVVSSVYLVAIGAVVLKCGREREGVHWSGCG